MSVERCTNISLISVLIPSYQSGEMLEQALESVLCQDYPAMEVVICDDGSEHFKELRLKELAKVRDSVELKVVHHRENIGTVRNLNSGLQLCTGKWVLLLAADDVLLDKNVVAQMAESAEKMEKNWLLGRTVICSEQLVRTGQICPTEEQIVWARDSQKLYAALCRGCFLPSSGNLYRMQFLRRMGCFDEHYRLVEDWPFFLKAARAGELPEVCDIPGVLHRVCGVSRNRAGKNRTYQKDLIETMEREILPYLKILPAAERDEIEKLCNDKWVIYHLRFELTDVLSKLQWIGMHIGSFTRKVLHMGRR